MTDATPISWKSTAPGEHFVQFYHEEEHLLEELSAYLAEGLKSQEYCLVIATPSHRDSLGIMLGASGIKTTDGLYMAIDAAQTLSEFMVDGSPDREKFTACISEIFSQAGGRPIRAFGEMVALLWTEGNQRAAIQLEQLWEELSVSEQFTLYCAYPIDGFEDSFSANPIIEICQKHSRTIPPENRSEVGPSPRPGAALA